MARVRISSNAKELQKRLGVIGANINKAVPRAMVDVASEFTRRMKETRFKGYRGSSYDNFLQNRSGGLRRSFGFKTRGSGTNKTISMFSAGVPYAAIHEFGGTIRGNPWLVFPVAGLTPTGQFRTGRAAKKMKWVKVKSVTIPPRLGFFDTWDKMERYRRLLVQDAVRRAVSAKGPVS